MILEDLTINVNFRGKNALHPFRKDWTINLTFKVFTKNTAPPLPAITNVLTKFHEYWTINVMSRVLKMKNVPPPGSNVFQPTRTIFELFQDIIERNILTKKNAQLPGMFQPTIQDIMGTNLLTNFHEDRPINAATRQYNEKRPPTGSHDKCSNPVSSRVLTRKNAPPPGGHVFQPTGTIFELIQDIIGINLLIKFNEDWKINVGYRVFTRFYNTSHICKNAPPPGGHVFEPTRIILQLVQDIIGTNLLTKFHEDLKRNVASSVS
ncbi:hypothetical protein DPMN_167900 [Dreissena polymorpha]|uniref:Uncharacterized protein n=1 Tax=Dreissena polymorpha TaxID=45954 RepID=A0A9D4F123_DREPO|nr:hypothetical protein DPMN_167900 [Dreissena polymorpha]